jgi:hypothetical protein
MEVYIFPHLDIISPNIIPTIRTLPKANLNKKENQKQDENNQHRQLEFRRGPTSNPNWQANHSLRGRILHHVSHKDNYFLSRTSERRREQDSNLFFGLGVPRRRSLVSQHARRSRLARDNTLDIICN